MSSDALTKTLLHLAPLFLHRQPTLRRNHQLIASPTVGHAPPYRQGAGCNHATTSRTGDGERDGELVRLRAFAPLLARAFGATAGDFARAVAGDLPRGAGDLLAAGFLVVGV
eukprot:SAG31_NODE_620_length_13503_cov_11.724112_3_plen_112_part_00